MVSRRNFDSVPWSPSWPYELQPPFRVELAPEAQIKKTLTFGDVGRRYGNQLGQRAPFRFLV